MPKQRHPALRAVAKLISLVLCFACVTSKCGAQTVINVGMRAGDTMVVPLSIGDSTTVRFSDGTWFAPRSILIDHAKSVVLEAQPGTHPVLSAGQAITGWKPTNFNGHDCWVANLPAVELGLWNFRELWVNGIRATRCRFPVKGYLASVEPKKYPETEWNQGQTWFGYKPGDLPDDLPKDAEAIVMNRWNESRLPIDSVDSVNHRVNSTRKSVFHLDDGDPYFLEGAAAWFDQPGEWYLDRTSGNLYYLPRARETIEKVSAIAPTRDHILEISGASNVTLRGLTFSNSEWNLPDPVPGEEPAQGGFSQSEVGVNAAVYLQGCRDCRIESCRFEHLGNYALELGKGCQHDVVERCNFTDLGCGGIKIGETDMRDLPVEQCFGNTVTDCRITDGGHLFPSACGIWVGQSSDNLIAHNELADLYQIGISIGWSWGYGPSFSKGNRIEANLIHHIGQKADGDGPIFSDMGGIYTLGSRPGTVISGNVIHDVNARIYGGWGIYLDEGSSGLLIKNNLVYRTTHGGFHIHFGKDNDIENNIFAFGRDLQIARTTVEKDLMLTFNHNIVYWDTGVFTRTDHNAVQFDENLYRCLGNGKLTFGEETFDQWKAAGQDVHSILADPGFADPTQGDFSMPADSPATRIGFVPFKTSDAGPR